MPRPTAAQLTLAITKLSANFGVDYAGRDHDGSPTADNLKVRMVFEKVRGRGWTANQFDKRLDEFIDTHRFPTWTIADFLGEVKPPALHNYAWYREQVHADRSNARHIACYEVPEELQAQHGERGWGWIHEVGVSLPMVAPVRETHRKQLPEHIEIDELTLQQIETVKRELELVRELREEITELKNKITELKAKKYELSKLADGRLKLLELLVTGEVTLEQLRAKWESDTEDQREAA